MHGEWWTRAPDLLGSGPCRLVSATGLLFIAALLATAGAAAATLGPRTPLERHQFQRISTSQEISEFLAALAARSRLTRVEILGRSAGGRPVEALYLSAYSRPSPGRLTILLVGTQHGTEPSGGEALLIAARDLVSGSRRPVLDTAEIILVPNANPDGRDERRRVNGHGVNLSTDFVTLSQPESRALNDLVMRERPEVVLDVHESAILKKRSLGRQGYLTDFEAQFEIANNPNIAPRIRGLSLTVLLPEIIARVKGRGLPAQRYIGEITSVRQPLTNGGLSLRNLRNKAGLAGAFSFLVENRLDPPGSGYPTLRNIRLRTAKQLLSVYTFLDTILAHRSEILAATRTPDPTRCVILDADYRLDTAHPTLTLPLRRRADGVLEARRFADHRAVEGSDEVPLARAYVITGHEDRMRLMLDRHRFAYRSLARRVSTKARALIPSRRRGQMAGSVPAADVELRAAPPDLWIDLDVRNAALLTLLLEPRSTSSVFQYPEFGALRMPGGNPFLYRVEHRGRTEPPCAAGTATPGNPP
ncbi:MAG: M14 family zinc carboxypeptidase [Gammaproteobacteria bacterium]